MNIELIREQMKGIEIEATCGVEDILNRIGARKQKRRMNLRIAAIILFLSISVGATQFQQISVFAGSLYRNIIISLNNETIVIDSLGTVPIELKGLNWVGKRGKRVGTKLYSSIQAVEEVGIDVLRNTISIDMNDHTQIPLIYFEADNIAELIFERHFIGDLKNYREAILENGDLQYSYEKDNDRVYQSPLSMKISFMTGRGENSENHNLEVFDYEEKYISPINGIEAYLMKNTGSIGLGDERIALRSAAGEIDVITVFANDNLLYTISGNVSHDEMKRIVDAFIIR